MTTLDLLTDLEPLLIRQLARRQRRTAPAQLRRRHVTPPFAGRGPVPETRPLPPERKSQNRED